MFHRGRRADDWASQHERARLRLAQRLDGPLGVNEALWLDEHLAGCDACRAVGDEYTAEREELRALASRSPAPPRDLWARTAAAIELEAGGSRHVRGRSRRPISLLIPSSLIAAALVVAVAGGRLFSSQLTPGGGSPSATPEVALASAPSDRTTGPVRTGGPGVTPMPVDERVALLTKDPSGDFRLIVKTFDGVCPEGSSEPCDSGTPSTERSVAIDGDALAVFGSVNEERLIVVSSPDANDDGSVEVVALTNEPAPSETPSVTPTPTPTDTATASPTVESATPSVTPATTASVAPTASPIVTPEPPASESPSSSEPPASVPVSASPDGGTLEIASGVIVVGQSGAYSASGSWFAFTARPRDGSAGPDVYAWRVGEREAFRVTNDGRSVFGSWVGDRIAGSAVVEPGPDGDPATSGLRAVPFVLDPATNARADLARSAWRPVVDPSGRAAVYWTGTVRATDEPGFAPETGRLVLGSWTTTEPAESAEPSMSDASAAASAPTPDPSTFHERDIAGGPVADFDARWDPSGSHLAVWVADATDPTVGELTLYAVDPFDASIDVNAPLLTKQRAKAGFALTNGSLVWADPSADPASPDSTVQVLAWTATGVGKVQTVTGPALVIR
jgi:hypothetical protein